MASYPTPEIFSYKAGAAIPRGMPVKIGADRQHVLVAAAKTDKFIGIQMNTVSAAEQTAEVAHPGRGGKVLLGATIAAGTKCTYGASGAVAAVTGEFYFCETLEDGVAGDFVACLVMMGTL